MGDDLLEIDLGSFTTPIPTTTTSQNPSISTNDPSTSPTKPNKVKCFGWNSNGQLGQGDTNNRGDEANEMGDYLLEIELGASFKPTQVVAGWYHTCALSTNNTVKCFGRNDWSQLGQGDVNDRGDEADGMGDDLLEIDLGSFTTPIPTTTTSQNPSISTNDPSTSPTK
eukprot:1141721_1